jgi:hypothetical protein
LASLEISGSEKNERRGTVWVADGTGIGFKEGREGMMAARAAVPASLAVGLLERRREGPPKRRAGRMFGMCC